MGVSSANPIAVGKIGVLARFSSSIATGTDPKRPRLANPH